MIERVATTVISVRGRDRDELLADPDFVYVGRWCAGWKASKWGNPFKVGMTRRDAVAKLGRDIDNLPRAERLDSRLAVAFYGAWLRERSGLMESLGELRGKTLGCWCCDYDGTGVPAKPCHAVLLARMADPA